MELNMILWTSYLLLMFCYDSRFLGDHHPITYLVGAICLAGSIYIFRMQLRRKSWGANIRMAIATVIVFWTPVEILGRIDFFTEVWVQPLKYSGIMIAIAVAFIVLSAILVMKSKRENK